MTWGKLDDGLCDHPKVLIAGNEAVGLWTRLVSWSSGHLTDGFVPDAIVAMYAGTRAKSLAKRLIDARGGGEHGLLEPADGGYLIHDFLLYNPSRDEVLGERARRAELRDREVVAEVRKRDGDRCRYCGVEVKWKDRVSDAGGTYDHVIPGKVGGAANLVVCCRGCNQRKGRRTPDDAGMTLLPAPVPNADLGRDLDTAQVDGPDAGGSASGRAGAGLAGPGLLGSGQDGSGRDRPGRAGSGLAVPARPYRTRTDASRCPIHHTEEPCRSCAAEAGAP